MKKKTIIFLSVFFLVTVVIETLMILHFGKPALESDPPHFQYQYVDIYKKFFKKVMEKDKDIYIPQRTHNGAKEFPATKSHNTVRIFLIGGSVAYNFGFFEFKNILKTLFPNKDFEVICCGMGAYDSNFRDCPPVGRAPIDRHYLLGCFLLENENYIKAIDEFKNFLKDNPRNPFGFYFLGRVYEKMQDYATAKAYYLIALDLDFVGGGRASYRRLKKHKESLHYFNEAISLKNNDYLSYLGCALIYYKLKKWPQYFENINFADEASKNLPNNLEVKYYKEILEF